MGKLSGKVAVVTGGNRGLGLAMVNALQHEGARVAVIGKKSEGEAGDVYIQADLSRLSDRHWIIKTIVDRMGRIDILVNNAGAQTRQAAKDYSVSEWNYDITLMLTAPFDLSQQAAKYMQGGGHIINMLSISALQGARNIPGYIAAKHGLLGLTRALAVEWAPAIHVNAIIPGHFETEMTHGISAERKQLLESITPAGRFGDPDEVADALMMLCTSTYIYGQAIVVDGGWMVKNG